MNKLDLSQVIKADVRLEGEVNTMWTLYMKDGSKSEYYAYESSPEYEATNERVNDHDEPLADFLESLILNLAVPNYDDQRDAIDYTVDLGTGVVHVYNLQQADKDYADSTVSYTYQL